MVNQMIVMPSHRDDNLLTTDVAYALQQDPATEAYEVLAVVEQGTARLGGSVDSYAER